MRRSRRRPLDLAALDEALVLELLHGGVDRAGARLPRAAGALGDLLDELVAVHLVAREHVEDGGAHVAPLARGPRRRPAAEVGADARAAEGADQLADPRGRAGASGSAAPRAAAAGAEAAEAGAEGEAGTEAETGATPSAAACGPCSPWCPRRGPPRCRGRPAALIVTVPRSASSSEVQGSRLSSRSLSGRVWWCSWWTPSTLARRWNSRDTSTIYRDWSLEQGDCACEATVGR